jgi:hypothetical protein
MGITYDPIRVRCLLVRAADWLLDGRYHLLPTSREELLDRVTVEEADQAAAILAERFGEDVDDMAIATIAIAIVLENELDWPEEVSDALDTIGRNRGR